MRERSGKIERQTGKRRLYVFSPSRQDRSYQLQMDALSTKKCALSEHDVEIDEILETDSPQTELRQEFNINPGQFRVILLGSDAHIKLSADDCVSCEELIMRVENEPQVMEIVAQ